MSFIHSASYRMIFRFLIFAHSYGWNVHFVYEVKQYKMSSLDVYGFTRHYEGDDWNHTIASLTSSISHVYNLNLLARRNEVCHAGEIPYMPQCSSLSSLPWS